jgi:hypothetical protein
MDGLVKGGVLRDDRYIAVTVTPALYGEDKTEVEIYG